MTELLKENILIQWMKNNKRSVTEQPKRSTAGQKIIDEMSKKKKKSNDIILDMNIIKIRLDEKCRNRRW